MQRKWRRLIRPSRAVFMITGVVLGSCVLVLSVLQQPRNYEHRRAHVMDKETIMMDVNKGHGCVIPVYARFQYQCRWTLEVMLSHVHTACGCSLMYRQETDMAKDFAGWDGINDAPFRDLIIVAGLVDIDIDRDIIDKYPEFMRSHATLIHMGDETGLARNDFFELYPLFKKVYRDYYYPHDPTRVASMDYLQRDSNSSSDADHIRWMPLGFSSNMIRWASPDLHYRSLLFFWGASMHYRFQRYNFKEALESDPNQVRQYGFVHTYSSFEMALGCSNHLSASEYSRLMHDSWIVPCPAGASAEQFRIYEALEAGAIPLVSRGQDRLQYLNILDLRHLTTDEDFKNDSVRVLFDAYTDTSLRTKLQCDQRHNRIRWNEIKERLALQFARDVCK